MLIFQVQSVFAQSKYVDFKVDPSKEKIKLYLQDDRGELLGSLPALNVFLNKSHQSVLFAMNAGMFMENGYPLGLYKGEGKTIAKLNTRKHAVGNFYIEPNGVFSMTDQGAAIVPTKHWGHFSGEFQTPYATQSGPMLLIDKKINPNIENAKNSRTIRNGVCMADKQVIFSVSLVGVSFLEFAKHFRDDLHCDDALYFDGAVSDFEWPEKGYKARGNAIGPMVVITN
jgi:uncharacterized protein YigE (DUF2233 family)